MNNTGQATGTAKKLVGTKAIIEAYLQNGGASMDEAHYQTFKEAMMGQWLHRYYIFTDEEEIFVNWGTGWISEEWLDVTHLEGDRHLRRPPLLVCRTCGEEFFADEGTDSPTTHLALDDHFPTMFHKQLPTRRKAHREGRQR